VPKAKILKSDLKNFSALRVEEQDILNFLDAGAASVSSIQAGTFGESDKGNYQARRFLRRIVRTGLVKKVSRGKYRLAAETRRMMARSLVGMENIRDK
jgi:hypothetical protein